MRCGGSEGAKRGEMGGKERHISLERLVGKEGVGDVVLEGVLGKLGESGEGGDEVGMVVDGGVGVSDELREELAVRLSVLRKTLNAHEFDMELQPLEIQVGWLQDSVMQDHCVDDLLGCEVQEIASCGF